MAAYFNCYFFIRADEKVAFDIFSKYHYGFRKGFSIDHDNETI